MKLETDNGEIVWVSCDLIQGYKYVNEYIDNNENKFKIMKIQFIIESITFRM